MVIPIIQLVSLFILLMLTGILITVWVVHKEPRSFVLFCWAASIMTFVMPYILNWRG